MNSEKNLPLQISRQDVIAFPFPYKLWLVVNSEACNFAKWNIDGTEIKLKIIALDDYLQCPKSLFEIKNRSSFIKQLENYGFVRTECVVGENFIEKNEKQQTDGISQEYTEFVINFKHVNFHRHRIDLLAKIREIDDTDVDNGNLKNPNVASPRINRGLCFMSHGAMSGVQMARIKYNTILKVKSEREVLRAKLEASALINLAKGQNNDGEESLIELSADIFENPHDSVLYMADDQRTDYAGFYGDWNSQVICMFFGEFLPMYQPADGSNDAERRITELNPGNSFSQPVDDMEITDSLPAETKSQRKSPTPLVSSSLQPIFTLEENVDNAEDISMEDFITFKENSTDSQLNDDSLTPNTYFKQVKDDAENETNFKNFFSQYRESLNLLYAEQ